MNEPDAGPDQAPTGRAGERGAALEQLCIRVEGAVQGVGFRPFACRLARRLGLAGRVWNDARGVGIEVEGEGDALTAFVAALRAEAPPLARIERLDLARRSCDGEPSAPADPAAPPDPLPRPFAIAASVALGDPAGALAIPDAATCGACAAEVASATDRRARHPFASCTDCGPRFTMMRALPYDRARTTMAGFPLCARCRAEYEDPGDRRFHAEPVACPDCGPRAALTTARGAPVALDGAADAIAAAARALAGGAIVGVKGLGGYHLAARADDDRVVRRLRARKGREAKPFAVMARDLDAARRLVVLDDAEVALLLSPARPIVLARRRADAAIAPAVAPRSRDLGVFLPYTPLHHLLLADLGGLPLVLTSANRQGEPTPFEDDEAARALATLADLVLAHDRAIAHRADDAVARVVTIGGERRAVLLRAGRGYAPRALPLDPAAALPVLGCGGLQKSAVCLARGAQALLGPHVGDLDVYAALRAFEDGAARLERLLGIEPEVFAHDLHPDAPSTRYALSRARTAAARGGRGRALAVQHHHAHLAGCLAEHDEPGPVAAAVFDGTGYGTDGTVWGGEVLVGSARGFERAGHLLPVPLPGGAAAIREPWRMAAAWLAAATGERAPARPDAFAGLGIDLARWRAVLEVARVPALSPTTTSAGRLCDAAAALAGVGARAGYEGQAAVEWEALAAEAWEEVPARPSWPALAGEPSGAPGDGALQGGDGGPTVLDPRPLLRALVVDLAAGAPVPLVAARFHAALADATAALVLREAARRGLRTAALTGGVFQNRLLVERAAARLAEAGLRVLIAERAPPNDGGLAYGQAAVAAARLAAEGALPRPLA